MIMKKIVLFTLITLLLSGCSLFTYKTKGSISPDYYEDYLGDLGYVDIVLVEDLISQSMMNMTYDTFEIDTNTKSNFIYYYICFDESGQKYHAFMPDKVGEENVFFQDFLIERTTLEDIVSSYNNTTDGVVISIKGNEINTLDIILTEDEPTYKFVEDLYSQRSVDGRIVDIDVEAIKVLIDESLSLPIVYNIGRYYVYGSSTVKTIYLGQGFDDELVFILEDTQEGTVEIIYIE